MALFFGHQRQQSPAFLRQTALYAYHCSIEWGVTTNFVDTVVFNSHWVRGHNWLLLPSIKWKKLPAQASLLEALSPRGIASGEIDRVANGIYEPDEYLVPVDDALVDRLDIWRAEAIRYSRSIEGLDSKLHTLFAQLFVLRMWRTDTCVLIFLPCRK